MNREYTELEIEVVKFTAEDIMGSPESVPVSENQGDWL